MVSIKRVECIFILILVHSEDTEGSGVGGGVCGRGSLKHTLYRYIFDSHLFLDEHKMGSSVSD